MSLWSHLHGETRDGQKRRRLADDLGAALHPGLVRQLQRRGTDMMRETESDLWRSEVYWAEPCSRGCLTLKALVVLRRSYGRCSLTHETTRSHDHSHRLLRLMSRGWRYRAGWVCLQRVHTNMFGPGAELRGAAKAWKKSGGLEKTSSSSSSKSARDFNRSGGRRGELLSWWEEEEKKKERKKKKESGGERKASKWDRGEKKEIAEVSLETEKHQDRTTSSKQVPESRSPQRGAPGARWSRPALSRYHPVGTSSSCLPSRQGRPPSCRTAPSRSPASWLRGTWSSCPCWTAVAAAGARTVWEDPETPWRTSVTAAASWTSAWDSSSAVPPVPGSISEPADPGPACTETRHNQSQVFCLLITTRGQSVFIKVWIY